MIDQQLAPVLADVQRVAGWLWQRGWAEAGAGNVSVDVSQQLAAASVDATLDQARSVDLGGVAASAIDLSNDTPPATTVALEPPVPDLAGRYLLVSAAGARFRDIAADPTTGLLLMRIGDKGREARIIWAPSSGDARPTTELMSHLLIQAAFRARGAPYRVVLHTHASNLIAINHTRWGAEQERLTKSLWSMLPEVKMMLSEGVGLVPYLPPGSRRLAHATAEATNDHRVVIWDKHGCLAVEGDVVRAYDLLEVADKAAGVFLQSAASGQIPRGLTDDELGAL